jgi:hypothetical protein
VYFVLIAAKLASLVLLLSELPLELKVLGPVEQAFVVVVEFVDLVASAMVLDFRVVLVLVRDLEFEWRLVLMLLPSIVVVVFGGLFVIRFVRVHLVSSLFQVLHCKPVEVSLLELGFVHLHDWCSCGNNHVRTLRWSVIV